MKVALLGPWTASPILSHLGGAGADLPPGGRGMVMTMLADALLQAGHEVHVVSLDDDVERRVDVDAGPLAVTLLPRRGGGRGRDAYAVERRQLVDALADVRADVVNAHWSYEFAIAARHHPAPRVVTVHDWAPLELWYQPDPYRAVRMGMYVAALAGRPQTTAPSPVMVRRLRRVGLRQATVVPNGLPAHMIGPGPRDAPAGARLIAVADGFGKRKNTVALLHALPLIRRRHPDATLALVGPQHGPGEEAEAWARQHGLADGVEFLGFTPHDEVLVRMREADALLHPAREETFGMVLIEAMAQGTPVVGGHASGAVPWVTREGRAAELVDVESPEAVAATTADLLADADRWRHLSAEGYANVAERFTMPVVADAYLDVYRRTVEAPGR